MQDNWTYHDLCINLDYAYEESQDNYLDYLPKNMRTESEIVSEAKKAHKKKSNKKENPFLQYGTAIENFFNLEYALIKMFAVLSLLALIQMVIFLTYNDTNFGGIFQESTFSGLGQATNVCSRGPNIVDNGNFTFQYTCNINYKVTDVISTGIYLFDKGALDFDESLEDNLDNL